MMKRLHIVFVLLSYLMYLPATATPGYERSINDGWTFRKVGSPAAETVSLPHTWNVEDAVDDIPGYYRGTGWYDKTIQINDDLSGKKVFVRFEGANQVVDLYLNGSHAGNHKGGYTAFVFDISEYVHPGANGFRINVDNSHNEGIPPLGADFTFFGGIYRNVSLVFVPENHIRIEHYASRGVYIKTPVVSSEQASVHIETHLSICRPEKKFVLEHLVIDPDGHQVTSIRKSIKKPSASEVVKMAAVVPEPQLWDVDSPRLYSVVTRLLDKNGEVIDSRRNSFGIRTFKFDPDRGFFLNGRHLKLIGTNRHQDYLGKGNALPDEMHLRDIRLLKDMGGNFLRVSHYPQDELISDECDRLGILTCMEIPVVNRIGLTDDFASNSVNMAREMVYQNYNHPSMVAWAYMNEVLLDNSPWQNGEYEKGNYYKKVNDCARVIDSALREADPSRLTMIPCDGDMKKYKESGLGDIPDILGFNLYHGWYYSSFDKLGSALDKIHDTFPGKALIVSEYGADADSRLRSFEPECQDYTCDYALQYHKRYIPVIMEKEYISGGAVWNLNDFHSEARGFAVPHFNCKGITASDRTPKNIYWLYKALYGKGPFIRIDGSDWKIRAGQEVKGECIQPVEIFASATEVELSLNGRSLGTKTVKEGSAIFDVPFIGGENVLEARGLDGTSDILRIDFRMIPEDMSEFREISVLMGTRRYFEDRTEGLVWVPEQEYRPGSWGYVGGERMYQQKSGGPRPAFEADIIGTDLDPLFQTQRAGLDAFKADIPDGRYFVYLYFAELTGPFRGKPIIYDIGNVTLSSAEEERVFSVSINGTTVLREVNIAREYGYNTAVVQRFPVEVEDGSGLDIGFIKSKGIPVLNAIRIIRVQ